MSRTAVVTGGASGIGAAVVERLEALNYSVHVFDVQGSLKGKCVDVTDESMCRRALADLGGIDVLVNSAGIIGTSACVWEYAEDEFEKVVRVNLLGTYYMCRAAIPGMLEKGWGRVVNIASIAGKEGNPKAAAYSASKAGVIGLTKSLAKETAAYNILVNCVTPAVIETPMNGDTSPELLNYMISKIPMNRVGKPSEVAALVGWLCSDECTFSTGAVFDISGGRATY